MDAAAEVTTDSLGAIDDEIEVDPALDEFESLDDLPGGEETYLDAYQKKKMAGSKEAVV